MNPTDNVLNEEQKKEINDAVENLMVTKDKEKLKLVLSRKIKAELLKEMLFFDKRTSNLLSCDVECEKLEKLFDEVKGLLPGDKQHLIDEIETSYIKVLDEYGENRYHIGYTDATMKYAVLEQLQGFAESLREVNKSGQAGDN